MGAHIEFDETAQKLQLRHDLASTTTAMGVMDAWHQQWKYEIEIATTYSDNTLRPITLRMYAVQNDRTIQTLPYPPDITTDLNKLACGMPII